MIITVATTALWRFGPCADTRVLYLYARALRGLLDESPLPLIGHDIVVDITASCVNERVVWAEADLDKPAYDTEQRLAALDDLRRQARQQVLKSMTSAIVAVHDGNDRVTPDEE